MVRKNTRYSSYVFPHLRVHDVGANVSICDVFPKFAPQLCLDLLEVQGLHGGARTSIDSGFIPDNLGAERLWEASHRLSEVALEELDNGRREIELISTSEDIRLGERVRCHPLGEITNDLRRRRNFDDVTTLDQKIA